MSKVLLPQPIHADGRKLLSGFTVVESSDLSEAALKKDLAGVEGVIVRTIPFTRSLIEAAPDLKVIARHGVGYDNIDVEAATEHGILVCNTPTANALSVAEHALTAIAALAKRVLPMDRGTRENRWKVRDEYKSMDLSGKVLGLVGAGRIGSLVARKARAAFDMDVLVYDPYLPAVRAAELGVRLVPTVEELLREADFVSLHLPLTPEATGLLNAARLRLLKPTAYLINFARGPIVVEADLVAALQAGSFAGAALDVYDPEPPAADNPLFALDNVILSPHSAALTKECVARMSRSAAEAVRDTLSGIMPEFVVNREVAPRFVLAPRP